jgi:serine/threonine protein kinase
MDPNRWRQIEDLYHLALEKPAHERAGFLDRACSADPSLRQEMESLLAIADGADAYVKAAVREASFSVRDATATALTAPNPGSGPQKLGRYELQEQVGRGGMGVVYRAIDPAIGRTVAIKTMVINDGSDAGASELRTRLLRESQAGGQLSHPNIVAVYDVSEQGNIAYIVMEFIVGRSLDKALAQGSSDTTLRATSRVMRIVQECASALDYAHSRGVIHRDIKPGNIMLQADGSVKIADFGIAKAAQFTALTQTAAVLGSPDYMAPEQWKGEAVTGQADQYALAVVAFALLTGRRPFESATMASTAAKTLYEEPPNATSLNRDLPADVDVVFRRALSKLPTARYQTCSQFAAALRMVLEPAPVTSPLPTSIHKSTSSAPRKLTWLAAVAVLAVLAAAIAGLVLYQRNSARQVEIAYWTSIKDGKTADPFNAYLQRYPDGQFAGQARAMIASLGTQRPPDPVPVQVQTETQTRARAIPAKKSDESTSLRSNPDSRETTTASTQSPPVSKIQPPPAADPYAQAETLLKSGAYAEAVPYFSQSIAASPDYRSYFGRAGAYQRLEKLDQAIDDYTQAIRLNSGGAMAYHERAVCLARLNQDDRAFPDYSRAIELSPGYALSWNGRGVIYLHRKDYENAKADFTRAIQLDPTLYQAYKNRSAAKKALGDTAGALADMTQANSLKK